ncbi:methyl-accepting chemotaxis protein [Pseudooceanicola sp. LIPI14-2-Ac024]|uniref:methyl-accepting chemotaxis protein n=1 Tax=Pseudooceanicola sp. LIPI14-2-Ac024 TaxID=3344875 RepID=UPI0035D0714B
MNAPEPSKPSEPGRGWSPFRRMLNLRLVVKLPLVISGLTLVVAVVLTVSSIRDGRVILEEQIRSQFEGTVAGRINVIEQLLRNARLDTATQAENPTVRAAMASFQLSWNAVEGDTAAQLQKDYVQDNPHPAGARDELVSTGDSNQYDLVHRKFHPYFRAILDSKGYPDAYLVNAGGQVIYSVKKGPDYATDLTGGTFGSTDLARAWRDTTTARPGDVVFYDISEYAGSGGGAAGFLATPIFNRQGAFEGALIFQISSRGLDAIAGNTQGLGSTGQVYIVGEDYRLRSNPTHASGLKVLDPVPPQPIIDAALRGETSEFTLVEGLSGQPVWAIATGMTFLGRSMAVMVEEDAAEVMGPMNQLRNTLVMQSVVLSLVIGVIGIFFARAIAKPFSAIGDSVTRMSRDDFVTPIPYRARGDDVGDLARNLENLREKLSAADRAQSEQRRRAAEQQAVVEQLSAGISKLAGGDLTAKIADSFAAEYEGLRNAFNSALERLNETMTGLISATKQIDTNSRDVENASNELSQKAIEQAASLEETAAAITELSASVKSTADAAGEADTVMSRAKSDAEASGNEVKRAMTAMDQIASSSQKITQVTSVIEDLAFQTNLLALNAGVEAARAGEAGRGFAVVASEVRALAQRSSDAAKEINGLIQESADNVTNGVDLVEKAGKSFESLILDFEKVSASVSSIAAAAREQSVGLSEINTAVDQLDGVTQKNAAVATEVHGTGKVMVNEAAKLNRIAAHFRIDPNAPATVMQAAPPVPQPPMVQPAAKVAAAGGGAIMGVEDLSDDVWAEF